MIIYLLLIGLIVILNLTIKPNLSLERKQRFLGLSFFVIFIIMALRSYQVGVDTEQYYRNYMVLTSTSWNNVPYVSRYELGYMYFVKFLTMFSSNPQTLLIVSSGIITFSIYKFLSRYSSNAFVSVLCFIFLQILFLSMNVLRQTLSLSIILLGWRYFENKKIIPSIIITLLSAQIHTSGYLYFLLIPIFFIKFKVKYLYFIVPAFAALLVFYRDFFVLFIRVFPQYESYVYSQFFQSNYFGSLLDFLFNLVLLIFGLIILYRYDRIRSMEHKVLSWLMIIYVAFLGLVMQANIFNRFAIGFAFVSIIWLPKVFTVYDKLFKYKFIKGIVYCAMITYFFVIAIFRPEWNGAIPYEFFF